MKVTSDLNFCVLFEDLGCSEADDTPQQFVEISLVQIALVSRLISSFCVPKLFHESGYVLGWDTYFLRIDVYST